MEQQGARVSLRAVIGGLCVPGYARFLWDAYEQGQTFHFVLGCLAGLVLAIAGFVWMRVRTREHPERRGWQRWLIETMKLTGTLAVVGLLLIICVRSTMILAEQISTRDSRR